MERFILKHMDINIKERASKMFSNKFTTNTVQVLIIFMIMKQTSGKPDYESLVGNMSHITSSSSNYLSNTDEFSVPVILQQEEKIRDEKRGLQNVSSNEYKALLNNSYDNRTIEPYINSRNVNITKNRNVNFMLFPQNKKNITTTSQSEGTEFPKTMSDKSQSFLENNKNPFNGSTPQYFKNVSFNLWKTSNNTKQSSDTLLHEYNIDEKLIYKSTPTSKKFNRVITKEINKSMDLRSDESNLKFKNNSGEDFYDKYFSSDNNEFKKDASPDVLYNNPAQLKLFNKQSTYETTKESSKSPKSKQSGHNQLPTTNEDFLTYFSTEMPESATSTINSNGIQKPQLRPVHKQGKQINISHRDLMPHQQLQYYIDDAYIRTPLAVIVDPSTEILKKTKALWASTLRSNFNIKIILVCLNASDSPSAYNFNNTSQFLAGLNSIKENVGGDSLIGVDHAAELIPYDSVIFMSTAKYPPHAELLQDAATKLFKKRIRLYLIWYGQDEITDNETPGSTGGILGDIAVRSGGEILHIVSKQNSKSFEERTGTFVAMDLQGTQQIDIPIQSKGLNLNLQIDEPMTETTLQAQNGEYVQIEKYTKEKRSANSMKYWNNSFAASIELPNVKQKLKSKTHSEIILPGPYSKSSLEYNSHPPKNDVETFTAGDITKNYSLNRSLIKSNEHSIHNFLEQFGTQIELGAQSNLIVAPGMKGKIYFQLTNTRSLIVNQNIRVVDERSYLLDLQPRRITLRPEETVTITLTVIIPTGTPKGVTNRILFTVGDNEVAGNEKTLIVHLKVGNILEFLDATLPTISWRFRFRCNQVHSDSIDCGNEFWSIDIVAHDEESGIVRVLSNPSNGLIYPSTYSVGSTEPIKINYISSCCNPSVKLTAIDVVGNLRSYTVDVHDFDVNDAAIAAIVLGVILIVVFLTLTVIVIIWCCRRKHSTFDIPRYRSHSTRSVE